MNKFKIGDKVKVYGADDGIVVGEVTSTGLNASDKVQVKWNSYTNPRRAWFYTQQCRLLDNKKEYWLCLDKGDRILNIDSSKEGAGLRMVLEKELRIVKVREVKE